VSASETQSTSGDADVVWVADGHIRVGDVEFQWDWFFDPTPERFNIAKPEPLLRAFVDVLAPLRGGRILEFGTAQFGSAALMALLTRPEKLVTIDLAQRPAEPLLELARRAGLEGRVRAYAGIDQADRSAVAAIVEEEFGDELIDLVIDDASHALGPTRATFEQIFPRVRPECSYLIEDWNWEQRFADLGQGRAMRHQPDEALVRPEFLEHVESLFQPLVKPGPDGRTVPPLLRIGLELVLAGAGSDDAIRDVTFSPFWISVERGYEQLDPEKFRLADLAIDHFGLLAE
jgi:predicted O-methyltransferase YrrM